MATSSMRALYVSGNVGKHQEAQFCVKLLVGDSATLVLEKVKLDLPELQGTFFSQQHQKQ
jgi:hypothetical protein